jgi:CubicO group peptidase (beta-lactamase class C family)
MFPTNVSFSRVLKNMSIAVLLCCITAACSSNQNEKRNAAAPSPDTDIMSNDLVTNVKKAGKSADYWPSQYWLTTAPEQQGIDSNKLAAVIRKFPGKNLHSAIVIRNGYIVAEGYNADYVVDTPQDLFSVTKSITGILTGIAIQEGKLKGTAQKLTDFYPQLASDSIKSTLTLGNLLSMNAGLEWDNTNERSTTEMYDSPNWVQYVLNRPVLSPPGKIFQYSNGNAHVMSAILQKATGKSTTEYARDKLFDPIGIKDVMWYQDPQGIDIGAFAVQMRARDMARLGFLYLYNGKWDNKQIVPESWVENSVTKKMDGEFNDGTKGGYGYFWWLKHLDLEGGRKADLFYAAGSGGQRIYVVPEYNLIFVVTANITQDSFVSERFLSEILLSISSEKTLPDNPEGVEALQASIDAFKQSRDTK